MSKLSSEKHRTSDSVFDYISKEILAGRYQAGEKLPAERLLAKQLQTSRPSVRDALAKLELQGLITRVQGGGTYVSDTVDASFSDPLLNLFNEKKAFKYDVLEYRQALEEAACALAAENGTDEDKQNIKQAFEQWEAAYNAKTIPEVEAKADLAFHLSIAEATHNYIFPHAMKSSYRMLEKSITMTLQKLHKHSDAPKGLLVKQHTAILNAILRSDADGAREAVKEHLNFVREQIQLGDLQAKKSHQK